MQVRHVDADPLAHTTLLLAVERGSRWWRQDVLHAKARFVPPPAAAPGARKFTRDA